MTIKIKLPSLSPTMQEATLIKWCVVVGDEIKPGDIIAEVETDKAVMDLEAIDTGIVTSLLVEEGAQGIAINSDIAILNGEDTGSDNPQQAEIQDASNNNEEKIKSSGYDAVFPDDDVQSVTPSAPAEPDISTMSVQSTAQGDYNQINSSQVRATPLARRFARQFKIDIHKVQGTGPYGRIVKADVENAAQNGLASFNQSINSSQSIISSQTPLSSIAPLYDENEYELVPLTGMRVTIAERLTQSSRDIPHFPITVDCEVDAILEQRQKINDDLKAEGSDSKISLNDFIIRATALALMKVPQINSSYTDDGIMMHKHADIAVAVAMKDGLITPILRQAETKGLLEISEEMRDLAARAKEKRLRPEEYQGGSFSISNMGMYGLKDFVSIINPPHGAILSIGAINEKALSKNGQIYSGMVMSVTLVCDHRVIDGLPSAEFIRLFKEYLENPLKMLL